MKGIVLGCIGLLSCGLLLAQRTCTSFEYQQGLLQMNPSLQASVNAAENFVLRRESRVSSGPENKKITIPVIVHILYHYPTENVSDQLVTSQIAALNRDFRKDNADTTKIPIAFKSLAADCNIEFQLATTDEDGRAIRGIIHKYTPVTKWTMDDKIKSSVEMGDDAWDANNYLNIWVGTLDRFLGYSSVPGDPADRDGVVISNKAFGITNKGIYDQGRTAVHEIGHWLGLRHLWGDKDCGDDGIADTPTQQTFTNGCPTSIHISCNNGPNGDMYMDYMDFTNDDCLVMFTLGQKRKMLTLFDPGGPRYPLLSSTALSIPTKEEIPPVDDSPRWLQLRIYPNPGTTQLTIDVEYDSRWIGNEFTIFNDVGSAVMKGTIHSKVQTIDVSKLQRGVYFITAEKQGEKMRKPFVKL